MHVWRPEGRGLHEKDSAGEFTDGIAVLGERQIRWKKIDKVNNILRVIMPETRLNMASRSASEGRS
jgi:hypothetical protein